MSDLNYKNLGMVLIILFGFVLNVVSMQIVGSSLKNLQGAVTGLFLLFYGFFRFFIEYFREPDGHIGLIYFNFSMGQILSFPMIISGLYFMIIFYNKKMDY